MNDTKRITQPAGDAKYRKNGEFGVPGSAGKRDIVPPPQKKTGRPSKNWTCSNVTAISLSSSTLNIQHRTVVT